MLPARQRRERKKRMKYVDPEEIVDHLSSEVRKALKDAVQEVMPSAQFDEQKLFRAFKRALSRKCSRWEQVSDRCVKD
jgi:hypothetical protein